MKSAMDVLFNTDIGEIEYDHDTRFSDAVKRLAHRSRSDSMSKHFGTALSYLMQNVEKCRGK